MPRAILLPFPPPPRACVIARREAFPVVPRGAAFAADKMAAYGEDGEAPSPPPGPGGGVNVFANDGSFLELFKRKMERSGGAPSFVGRRRGGNKLALKTGVVAKKQKTEEEVLTSKGDAWAKYMAEVKKYKAHQCSDDDKTRPLVK
nr:telomerase RNA component interacting RNase [Dromaius novaehollandiae]